MLITEQKKQDHKKTGLCASIIGGGPAGSFLAIHLLEEARKANKTIQVTIIDQRISGGTRTFSYAYSGCNYCAGVISPVLNKEMHRYGIRLPHDVVCEEYSHIWIHGQWKNFPLKVPKGERLCSIFRGSMPPGRGKSQPGLDWSLLQHAKNKGAELISGTVMDIGYTGSNTPYLELVSPSGKPMVIESDFLGICTGVNGFSPGQGSLNPLLTAYKKINPAFKPPQVRPSLVFEMKPGREYLHRHMHKELYLIISGSDRLHLEHIALVPKGDYLTAALTGKSIDDAVFPGDKQKIIQAFFDLPHIKSILPRLTADNATIVCSCTPNMIVKPAVSPACRGMAMAGDILGARLYRDGLYSAFLTAGALARTVVKNGTDKKNLNHTSREMIKWLKTDNFYCRLIFNTLQKSLSSDSLSRVLYQTFATEMKFKKMDEWPMGSVLWKVGSGSADYNTIFSELFSFPVIRSFATGTLKTLRNRVTEYFFGLKWGDYGRYPAVILKEKRKIIKKSIQSPLGIELDDSPQMERMYAVKIKASAKAIFDQLAAFGEQDAQFLQLRFVDVTRCSGKANQPGSIVRYHLRHSPVSMDIRLVKSLENRSLLYQPQELFTTNGVLLFDIAPTRGGNSRLVIYTAFDYKKGSGTAWRLFFRLFRQLFPDYAHDVVWNHAICTIKAGAEQADQSIIKTL